MKLISTAAVLIGTLVFGTVAIAAEDGPTLASVKNKDKVVCGANGGRPGFSGIDSKGQWQGIDVEVCRAVAAATLGDAKKAELVKVSSQTRFTALQTSEVDLLAANVTWTYSRDTNLGLDFVAPIFYDGQAFMVSKQLGVKSVSELDGATICIEPGSTSEKIVADIFRAKNMKYKPVVIEDRKELNNAFFSGRCDVHVQSTSGLSSGRATAASNPDDYIILPEVFGKDPMAPVVRQGDAQWRDIVNWTVYAMIAAEELGITSKNVDEMKKSDNADVARLLGAKDELGKQLALNNDWAYQIIKQVGNYGEVFERTVGKASPLKLDRGLNRQWVDGGLLYAPPFN
ncbi:amino acid ABC transporter substrate-binding protein [Pollutimonas sp. H1-120]|uniref:amino acid ABC transporter substrate-binding protein n=1 Tax=Pollutimonas sp. H1-120 TaxID=3148824 RepID=UPI003B52DD59